MRVPSVLLAACVALALPAAGKRGKLAYLYTYTDSNGGIVIDNRPPAFMPGHLRLNGVTTGPVRSALTTEQVRRVVRDPKMLTMVEEISEREGVDPWLAKAVIQAESAFRFEARSKAGALGLMQLMPATARRFGVLDPFDPRQNITGGVKYLRWLHDRFNGDLTKVVAAYNAGERNVERHGGIPPFAETRAYVPRVLGLWKSRAVVADPRAAGGMELLKKGRGGFIVPEEKVQMASNTGGGRLFTWRAADGGLHITDTPPPPGAREIVPEP